MSSGTCGCHGYDLTQGDDYKLVLPEFSYLASYIGGFSEDVQRQVVELLCSGVIALGDMDQVGWVYCVCKAANRRGNSIGFMLQGSPWGCG